MAKLLALVLFGFFITGGIPTARSLNIGLKNAVVCEGKKSTISCKNGYTISIALANYGRDNKKICPHKNIRTTKCISSRSVALIKAFCNGRKSCSLFASNSVFGDPCRGTHKYIQVLYICRKTIVKWATVCERSYRSISCPKGQLITIQSASYGRRDRSTCPSSSIKTISCAAKKSANIIKNSCNNKRSCLLIANNGIFGDPCVGTYKYLTVSYLCMRPRLKEVVACERKPGLIACPSRKTIRIYYASYGRTDKKTCPHSSMKTTNCHAQSSIKKLANCNGKRSCILNPSNSVFGDPCKGTHKYLRVYYDCI